MCIKFCVDNEALYFALVDKEIEAQNIQEKHINLSSPKYESLNKKVIDKMDELYAKYTFHYEDHDFVIPGAESCFPKGSLFPIELALGVIVEEKITTDYLFVDLEVRGLFDIDRKFKKLETKEDLEQLVKEYVDYIDDFEYDEDEI